MGWDAIILAGGRGERLGGTAKPDVLIGETTLLNRTVAALQGAERIVIAGNVVVDGCITAIEAEPFGGPVSGLAAALPHATSEQVLVVACDHPFLHRAVRDLLQAEPGPDGVIAVSRDRVRQNLMVSVRRAALVAALNGLGSPTGASMRHLLASLDLREIVVDDAAVLDVDTWDDVAAARELELANLEVMDDD